MLILTLSIVAVAVWLNVILDMGPGRQQERRAPLVTSTPPGRLPHYYYNNCVQCIDIGDLAKYNGIIYGNYQGSTDTEGKLVAGGNVDLGWGYSVANMLFDLPRCQEPTLIVGKNLKWPSGRNYFGNIVVGGTADIGQYILDYGCTLQTIPDYYNMNATHEFMKSLSAKLAAMNPTITHELLWTNVTFTLDGTCNVQVFNADTGYFFMRNEVKYVQPLVNYVPGSVVIFNIPGDVAGITYMNMENLANIPVIFNFYEATNVTIHHVAVRGYVLAPHAKIINAMGVIYGSIYALELTGPIQLNWVPYNFCPSPPPHPCPLPFDKLALLNGINAAFHSDVKTMSDTEGKLMVGGNATLGAGYSIGDKLKDIGQCDQYTLVVGGALDWPSGRNYFGNIAVGQNTSTIGNVLDPGCYVDVRDNAFDFTLARQVMIEQSEILYSNMDTIQHSYFETDMTLYLEGGRPVEYMTISNPQAFNGVVKRILAPNNYVSGVIIVFNIVGQSEGIVNMNMESLAGLPVIFNFVNATDIEISGVAVRGFVLAPYAHIRSTGGVVWGGVYAFSLDGNLQFNLIEFPLCPPPCPPPPNPEPCVDIGPLSKFNIITRQDYQASSDVQGRVAVGRDAFFYPGFSVGDLWVPEQVCQEAAVIVKRKLSGWITGRSYHGHVVVGDPTSVVGPPVLDPGCQLIVNPNYFDFDAAHVKMAGLSAQWSAIPPTITTSTNDAHDLTLTLTGGGSIEVFYTEVSDMFVNRIKRILPPVNYRKGVVIVMNIRGETSGFFNMNLEGLAGIPVIWNFFTAKTLTITGVAVHGYVVAPFADVVGATGVIHGSVYLNSMTGSIQINKVEYSEFCIPGYINGSPLLSYQKSNNDTTPWKCAGYEGSFYRPPGAAPPRPTDDANISTQSSMLTYTLLSFVLIVLMI